MNQLKEQLYQHCKAYIADSIEAIEQKINDAQDAANEDSKSSAGDKYETGREMMQQEIDLNTARLAEIQKQKEALDRISPAHSLDKVQVGSLVHTSGGNYFIAIPAGKLTIDGTLYYAISSSAPITEKLMGKAAGDTIEMNGKKIEIKQVI